MKLPHGNRAVVDEQKVREYLLSESHPVGRFKAAFFRGLGFGRENWQEFRDAILPLAADGDAVEEESSEYGQKYRIVGEIVGPNSAAEVVTVWILRSGADRPSLVTVYPR